MPDVIRGFIEDGVVKKYDYNYLANKPSCVVIAHRGYSRASTWARDNSQMSLVTAFANGFGGVECDVRKDVNGELVLLHNTSVDDISAQTGDIDTLDYRNVEYQSEIGVDTNTTLCTAREGIALAKMYNGFLLFDIKLSDFDIKELADLCEELEFTNYGVFNLNPESDLALLPDTALKVWGNNVFSHTSDELDSYLAYGTKNNAVRLVALADEQVELIKSKGFKILFNYTATNLNNDSYIQKNLHDCDYIMGDYIPTNYPDDKRKISGSVSLDVSIIDWLESLSNGSVREFYLPSSHSENTTGFNLLCKAVKVDDDNIAILANNINGSPAVFCKAKFSGTWRNWTVNGVTAIIDEVTLDSESPSPDCRIKVISNGSMCTVTVFQESTSNEGTTGWTTLYTLPLGYRPPVVLISYFNDGNGYPIRMRINSNGAVDVYSIPDNRQFAGTMTFPCVPNF